MSCQLLSTCSDMTLHMVEACSACFMLGPQLWNHRFWKGGVLARRRGKKGIHPRSVRLWEGGHCLSPLFPGRALEQDEVIKVGCQRILSVSLLCKLHAQMLLFRIRPHWLTFITPPLQLIWYHPELTSSSLFLVVFLQYKRCERKAQHNIAGCRRRLAGIPVRWQEAGIKCFVTT